MLVPREHGAYGQLAFPLITALAIGRPTAAAFALALASVAAFLGHESLLVVLGQRGRRAAREQRAAGRRSLLIFGTAAMAFGTAAVILMPPPARRALIVPAGLGLVLVVVVASGRERTAAGEVLVAATLSSLALPTAIAAQTSAPAALTVALDFAIVFLLATLAVRAVISRATHQRGPSRLIVAIATLAALGGAAVLGWRGVVVSAGLLALIPVTAVAAWLIVKLPPPRYLRLIGWTLVAATTLTATMAIAVLR